MNLNLIAYLIEKRKEKAKERDCDIYNRMNEMTRQNFHRYKDPTRIVSPEQWPLWRKALKMTEADFWCEARNFFERPKNGD